jgi:hypothetical protein
LPEAAAEFTISTMQNSLTRIPSWVAAHWRGAALVACAIGAVATWRWSYGQDPQRVACAKEQDLKALAEKISRYASEMQAKYPSGSVVVSEEDLAGALHRAPEKVITALRLLHSEQKVEPAPLIGYWKLNVDSD